MNSTYENIMEAVYTNEQMLFESWDECVDYVHYRRYPDVDNYLELAMLMTGARLLNGAGEDITEKTCLEDFGIKYEELEIHKEWQPLLQGLAGIVRAKTIANKKIKQAGKRGRKPNNKLLKKYMEEKQITSEDLAKCFGKKKSFFEKALRTKMSNAMQFQAMSVIDECAKWKESKACKEAMP